MPEFLDLVFAKTSPKRSFPRTENERFGLVLAKNGSINSGTGKVYETGKPTVLKTLWRAFKTVCMDSSEINHWLFLIYFGKKSRFKPCTALLVGG